MVPLECIDSFEVCFKLKKIYFNLFKSKILIIITTTKMGMYGYEYGYDIYKIG